MNRLYDQTATLIRWIYDCRIIGPPVLDLDTHFPAGERFAAAWRALRDEALAIATRLAEVPRFHEIMPEQTEISANDARDWRMFIIKAYGVEVPENKARCPALAAIVASAPEVLSASYSFMAPGKHIPAHRGPFRGVLRFYLALSMPRLADGRPGAGQSVFHFHIHVLPRRHDDELSINWTPKPGDRARIAEIAEKIRKHL